jgi:hypothetical protein
MQAEKKMGYAINPKTRRPVKIGGGTWKKLVREGILNSQEVLDTHILKTIPKDSTPEEVKIMKAELDEKLPSTVQAVKGRGSYEGKIVKRDKPLSPMAIAKFTAQKSVQVIKKNIEKLALAEDDEIDDMLNSMIMNSMMEEKPILAPVKPPVLKRQVSHYQPPADFPEEEDESSEDDSQDEFEN